MDDRNFKNVPLTKLYFKNFKSSIFCLFLFYNVYKEKIFTIEIEDGREASCKPTIWKLSDS